MTLSAHFKIVYMHSRTIFPYIGSIGKNNLRLRADHAKVQAYAAESNCRMNPAINRFRRRPVKHKKRRGFTLTTAIVFVINKFLPLQTRDCLRQWRFFQENKAFQTYTSRLPDREIGFGLPFSTPPYGSWSCFLWFPAPAGFRKMP